MRRQLLAAGLSLAAAPAFAADAVDEFPTLVPGQAGSVELAYEIAPTGFVENCTVARSSGFPQLDAASCQMMARKARFAPVPARTRATRTIRWVEGAAKPQPAAARQDNHPFAGGEGTPDDWAALNGWGTGGR